MYNIKFIINLKLVLTIIVFLIFTVTHASNNNYDTQKEQQQLVDTISLTTDDKNISKGIVLEIKNKTAKGENKLVFLDSLCNFYLTEDVNKSRVYSKEMYSLAQQLNNPIYIHKAINNKASAYYQLQNYDSADWYVNKAIESFKSSKDELLLAKSYTILSDINYYQGKHIYGIENAKKALKIYHTYNDSAKAARLYKDIAALYREMGDYNSTIEYAIKSLKFFEKRNDSLYIADAYRTMASVYTVTSLNEPRRKLEYLLRAKDYLKNKTDNKLYAIVISNIAVYYSQQQRYDSAIAISHEVMLIHLKNQDSLRIANTNVSIGNNLLRMTMDSIVPAMKAFRNAMSIFKKLKLEKYICHMDYTFGEVYYFTDKLDSAEYYLKQSLALSKKINYSTIQKLSLKILTNVYEKAGDFENAFASYKLFRNYTDSTENERIRFKIAELETKYETAKKEQQILELEHQQEIQKSRELTLKAIILGVFIIFLLVVIGFWQKRKKDRFIHTQKEIVHRKEKELAVSELEKSKLKEKELQQSVLYKSKQLSTHALHMMQKNTMLQDIQSDIKSISKKANDDDKPTYRRIKLQISQSLRSQKDWDVFKLYFEDVNRDFYQKLNKINSDLTTNDHRLCALIKLNMTSKEMASVLNVAPNSIKSSRYRLKKKLGLDAEADLEDFIKRL